MSRPSTKALFEEFPDARAALVELRKRFPLRRADVHVTVQSAKAPASELRLSDTDGRRAMFIGIAWGALGGLIAVGVGALVGLRAVAVDAPTIAFAVVAGTAFGILGGALLGAANPSVALEQLHALAVHGGGVVISVETATPRDCEVAERILERHSGQVGGPFHLTHGLHPV